MIDASARQSGEDLTLERTYWASTGIEFSGMSRAESAPAMIADAFHQVGSLDRLRAAYMQHLIGIGFNMLSPPVSSRNYAPH